MWAVTIETSYSKYFNSINTRRTIKYLKHNTKWQLNHIIHLFVSRSTESVNNYIYKGIIYVHYYNKAKNTHTWYISSGHKIAHVHC